jgi:hypothetical protein
MVLIDQLVMSVAPTSTVRLDPGHTFPKGRKARNVIIRTFVTVTNTTTSSHAFTVADAIDAFRYVYSSFKLQFGVESPDVVDNDLNWDRMRTLLGIVAIEDMSVWSSISNSYVQVGSVSATTAISGSVAGNGGSTNIELLFTRPFVVLTCADRPYAWLPGATQMSQMSFEISSGSTFNPTNSIWSPTGTISLRVLAEESDEADATDPWSNVVRMYRNTSKGISLKGPAGLQLFLADFSYDMAATPLTIFSLKRDNDTDLQSNIEFKDSISTAQFGSIWSEVGAGVNVPTYATVLWNAFAPSALTDFPTASGTTFVQPANDLASPDLLWIYIPPQTTASLNAIGQNATSPQPGGTGATTVNLTSPAAVDPTITANHVAVTPVSIIKPGTPAFSTTPAVTAQRGVSNTVPYTPPAVVAAVSATAPASAQAAAAAQAVARATPGQSSPGRANRTPGAGTLSLSIRSGGKKK